MENFSWFSSVIIPAVVSLFPGTLMYIVGIRKERNSYRNLVIEKINNHFDDIYSSAREIIQKEYSDADYHFMVYEYDSLHSELKSIIDISTLELPTLKRILTDHIFHSEKEKKNMVMETLSQKINMIKGRLKPTFW